MELGYKGKNNESIKHYRQFFTKEIEKTLLSDDKPFEKIAIYRGKVATEDNFLKGLVGGKDTNNKVGVFKAMISIMSETEKMRYDAKISHVGAFANTKGLEFSDEEFLKKRDVTVRVYVLEAEGLPDKDADSNSDPYLYLKLGDEHINVRLLPQGLF